MMFILEFVIFAIGSLIMSIKEFRCCITNATKKITGYIRENKVLFFHPVYELNRRRLQWKVELARPFFATPDVGEYFYEERKKYKKALDRYNDYVSRHS